MVSGTNRARVRRVSVAVAAAATLVGVTACTGSASTDEPGRRSGDADGAPRAGQPTVPVTFATNVARHDVTVDTEVSVSAVDGTLKSVRLSSGAGAGRRVPGTLSDDGTTWTADALLEPGQTYQWTATGTNAEGDRARQDARFATEDLSLDQQTYPSVAPLDGSTVGVGMPVIVTFDVAVTDRAAAERHLEVSSSPTVRGSWHWLSDTEVHFRPRTYWPSGAQVSVEADLNSVDVGNGIYGQESRSIDFTIGSSVVSKIDLAAHTMDVFIDGDLARTIPVTGGKPGFETRSGVKVIMEKFESKRMDAATTGIDPGNPEYYNLSDVEYAMRETYTGEFIHAAPWSVSSQGNANVSHGCVGMSTDNAAWLFSQSNIGDVVEVTGSDRGLEPGNGWTDWNVSFADYKQGSAL